MLDRMHPDQIFYVVVAALLAAAVVVYRLRARAIQRRKRREVLARVSTLNQPRDTDVVERRARRE